MTGLGKILIVLGLSVAALGVFLYAGGKVSWLGHLPGDIDIRTEKFRFYFPLGSSLLISGIVSLVFYLLKR